MQNITDINPEKIPFSVIFVTVLNSKTERAINSKKPNKFGLAGQDVTNQRQVYNAVYFKEDAIFFNFQILTFKQTNISFCLTDVYFVAVLIFYQVELHTPTSNT